MKKSIILLLIILLSSHYIFSQKTVSGTVTTYHDGNGLPGAIIKVKEYPNIATVSDFDGSYTLANIPDSATILIFSFIGLETEEVNISGEEINISLKPSEAELEEVVVTALGIRKDEKKLSYAVSTINNNYDEPNDNNTEEYNIIKDNEFQDVMQNPLSTFSIDVDNASYSNVRRFINQNQKPLPDAVRTEEMINYFSYDYDEPKGNHPFSIYTEISDAPWNPNNKLLHIGIQGKKLDYKNLQPCNFVLLLDVSGSMGSPNKLPLMITALKLLLNELGEKDRIAIVVYAGAAGLVLPSTPASEKEKIIEALDKLSAGGSTAGGEGIKLAYKIAQKNLIPDGNNRIILATDGDFNVGTSSTSELIRMVVDYRTEHDIYLTICGFGMGNYKDGRMEEISNAGNGNYFYIDNEKEAEKVFVTDMRANMFTVAKDVKIQIEFNPAKIKGYRLIGYENRLLANEDFKDDKKDAGELGPGHTVTALYELILVDSKSETEIREHNDLKYQEHKLTKEAEKSGELMNIKFRYKPPKSDKSILIEKPIKEDYVKFNKTSNNFRFSAAVAGFGMLLRDSKFKGDLTFDKIIELAKKSKGDEENGYRKEFIELVEKTKQIYKE